MSASLSVQVLATRGLVECRKGAHEQGRRLYLEAMMRARQKSEFRFEALAALYLAREEILANAPMKMETLRFAVDLAGKQREPDVDFVRERVLKMVESDQQGSGMT